MRLLAAQDRAYENRKIGYPDHSEPQVDIPFRLRIFARLGNAEQIARSGENDEQLVAPEDKPGETGEGKSRPARALNHVETGGNQRISSERKDHCRSMQRPQTPESREFQIEIQSRESQLQRDVETGQKTGKAPENSGNHTQTNKIVIISGGRLRRQRRIALADEIKSLRAGKGSNQGRQAGNHHMDRKGPIGTGRRSKEQGQSYGQPCPAPHHQSFHDISPLLFPLNWGIGTKAHCNGGTKPH